MKQVRSRSKWPAGRGGVPLEVRREMVVMVRAGASWQSTAERFGVTVRTVARVMRDSGGMPPRWSARSPLRLSVDERVLIMVGLEQARSFTAIAAELGRSPSTVSREIHRNRRNTDLAVHTLEDLAAVAEAMGLTRFTIYNYLNENRGT